MVLGDGMAAWDQAAPVSLITCTSQTAVLFTATATSGTFANIALQNTYAGTPSSASRGIQQTPTTGLERWDFDSVSVRGFYNDIDIGGGTGWTMRNCWIYGPVNYGVRVRNTVINDAGDWSISDTGIFAATYNAAAGLRIESSGGGKLTGVKINRGTDTPAKTFTYGIDINIATGVVTSVLLVQSTSIENVSSECIHATTAGTGSWKYTQFVDCELMTLSTTLPAITYNAASTGKLDWAIFYNCICVAPLASSGPSISLTNIVGVNILIQNDGFAGGVYTQSGSSTIRDLSTTAGYVTTLPSANGTAAAGSSESPARIDHVHPAGGAGNVATDTIWDAAGDLAVGTGADTAARLAKGSAGAQLGMANGLVAWTAGTSMPGTPATNDRYYRTDNSLEFVYDGTRWVCTCAHYLPMPPADAILPLAATANSHRVGIPQAGTSLRLYNLDCAFFVSGGTALGPSHKWVLTLKNAVSGATITTINIDSGASNAWRFSGAAINANLALTEFELEINAAKTGTPGSLYLTPMIVYRIIQT
jgi:hypothetical protein